MNNTSHLLCLVATEKHTNNILGLNTDNHQASIWFTEKFINNNIMSDYTELIKPQYIKSDKPIKEFIVEINHITVMRFPLNFMNKLAQLPANVENEYLYTILWDKFNNDPLYCHSNETGSNINFRIVTDDPQHTHSVNASLIGICTFTDHTVIIQRKDNPPISKIKQIQEHKQNVVVGNNKLKLDFHGLTKGFFIDNIKFEHIDNIALVLNGHGIFNHDNSMLSLIAHRITDDLMYIPLDNLNWDNDNFDGSLTTHRIDHMVVEIGSQVNTEITIYSIVPNKLSCYLKTWFKYNGEPYPTALIYNCYPSFIGNPSPKNNNTVILQLSESDSDSDVDFEITI